MEHTSGPTRIRASGKVTTFMDLEDLTIPALLKQSVDLYGGLPALALVGERPITYAKVQQRSRDLAGHLRQDLQRLAHQLEVLLGPERHVVIERDRLLLGVQVVVHDEPLGGGDLPVVDR